MVQFVINKKRLRSHGKSRGGCQSCKERKKKCTEERPICDSCARLDLNCVYPDQQAVQQRKTLELRPSLSENALNLTDLRLYHHFMLYAHPYLPFGRDSKWATDIAYQAQQFPYLMHAMLALSATHLGTYDTTIAPCVALSHRQHALKGLSALVSKADSVSETELESLIYASFALMFQAGYMSDGFSDYLSMLRGTGILAMVMMRRQGESIGEQITQDAIRNSPDVCTYFQHVVIDKRISEAAIQSYINLEHICPLDGPLRNFYDKQLDVARALHESSWEGYIHLGGLYQMLMLEPKETFAQIMDLDNRPVKILLAHLFALSVIFTPVRLYEAGDRAQWTPMEAIVAWIQRICESLPDTMGTYVAWPRHISNTLKEYGKSNRILTSNVARLMLDRPELFVV